MGRRGSGFRVLVFGCSVQGVGFRVQGVLSFGFKVQGSRFRASCFVFRVSCFVFRVSGFGLRVSGFGFRASGFGFRAWGFELRVSCFVFRVSGLGVRVSGLPPPPPPIASLSMCLSLTHPLSLTQTLPPSLSHTHLRLHRGFRVRGCFLFGRRFS